MTKRTNHRKAKLNEAAAATQLADNAVLDAAENFVQEWIAHPRNVPKIGHDHAELIRVVLNRRVAHGKQ